MYLDDNVGSHKQENDLSKQGGSNNESKEQADNESTHSHKFKGIPQNINMISISLSSVTKADEYINIEQRWRH